MHQQSSSNAVKVLAASSQPPVAFGAPRTSFRLKLYLSLNEG
jgi:hypothetical protein